MEAFIPKLQQAKIYTKKEMVGDSAVQCIKNFWSLMKLFVEIVFVLPLPHSCKVEESTVGNGT